MHPSSVLLSAHWSVSRPTMPEIELESLRGGGYSSFLRQCRCTSARGKIFAKFPSTNAPSLADTFLPAIPVRRGVQKKGCHALVNLMSNNEKNVATVARLGGCSAAVAAIRAHRDVGVHAQAIAALVSLSAERYFFDQPSPGHF
jgi:hypothetical protein